MSPANIEAHLKSAHPLIGQACCIGDARPYNTALIVLDADFAPTWAAQQGIEDTSARGARREPCRARRDPEGHRRRERASRARRADQEVHDRARRLAPGRGRADPDDEAQAPADRARSTRRRSTRSTTDPRMTVARRERASGSSRRARTGTVVRCVAGARAQPMWAAPTSSGVRQPSSASAFSTSARSTSSTLARALLAARGEAPERRAPDEDRAGSEARAPSRRRSRGGCRRRRAPRAGPRPRRRPRGGARRSRPRRRAAVRRGSRRRSPAAPCSQASAASSAVWMPFTSTGSGQSAANRSSSGQVTRRVHDAEEVLDGDPAGAPERRRHGRHVEVGGDAEAACGGRARADRGRGRRRSRRSPRTRASTAWSTSARDTPRSRVT